MGTLVTDLDGTICFDGRSIPADIVDGLVGIRSRHRLVIASARPIRDLVPVLPPPLADVDLIGGNGSFTRTDAGIAVVPFDAATRAEIDRIVDAFGIPYLIDGPWDYAYTGDGADEVIAKVDAGRLARTVPREELPCYAKALLFTRDPAVLVALETLPVSLVVHGEEGVVDIAPSGITKASALAALGIAPGGYAAAGNDANDVALLRSAAASLRVGRHPSLAFASRTAERTDVADALARLAAES